MKQVALRAGRPYHWLNDRVNGHAPIYADDLYALAKGLNVDPCDFFKEGVEPGPIPSREDREAVPAEPSRGIRFATRWADLIEAQIPDDDEEAEQLELALLRKMLELKEQRQSTKERGT